MGIEYSAYDRFKQIFSGNETGYGLAEIVGKEEGRDKVKANCQTIKSPLNPAIVQRHLEGGQSIGVSPLREDGTCRFAAIDIDEYKFDLMDIVKAIYNFHLPLFPCWSKSKHLHIYMFFSGDPAADKVVSLARRYLSLFCLPDNTEIFPKQTKVLPGMKFPSWINLPYFNANDKENHRKLVKADGSLCLSLSDALDYAESIVMAVEEHNEVLDDLPYHDAPPCITSGVLLRDIPNGSRNTWLFSFGVYLVLSGHENTVEDELQKVNASLKNPIPEEEITNTIAKGISTKTYFYKCKELGWRCNKGQCSKKEFGANTGLANGIEYGQMTKVMTDPPYWKWEINNCELIFNNAQELRHQERFLDLLVEKLNIAADSVPKNAWTKILNKAFSSMIEENVDEGNDFTPGAILTRHLQTFFWKREPGTSMSQVAIGHVFFDKDMMYFNPEYLLKYIRDTCGFREYNGTEIRDRLIKMGAMKRGMAWSIPKDAIKKPEDAKKAIEDLDFKDKETNNDPF